MKWFLGLLLIFCAHVSIASVKVAFFRSYDRNGKLIQLEPGGQFSHVAISYENQWLHVHPVRGVELIESLSTLKDIGEVGEVLVVKDRPDLQSSDIENLLGLPYDFRFAWDNPKATYCSKLVGQLLEIQPSPMSFETDYWKGREPLPHGELGLSPDDIYLELRL